MTRQSFTRSSLFLITLLASMLAMAAPDLNTALSNFDEGDYKLALKQFEALARQAPDDAELQYYLGRSLYRQRQFSEAERVLAQNALAHPKHAESHFLLGSVKLNRMADVNIFRKAGLAKDALASWKQSVALNENHIEGLYAVTSFLLNAPGIVGGDKKQGEVYLARLRAKAPAYGLLVDAARLRREDNFAAAESTLIQAINLIPDRAFPVLILTDLYIKMARYENALDSLEQYEARPKAWNDPGAAQMAYLRGKAFAGLGKITDAKAAFETALTASPTPQIASQAREALKELGG